MTDRTFVRPMEEAAYIMVGFTPYFLRPHDFEESMWPRITLNYIKEILYSNYRNHLCASLFLWLQIRII